MSYLFQNIFPPVLFALDLNVIVKTETESFHSKFDESVISICFFGHLAYFAFLRQMNIVCQLSVSLSKMSMMNIVSYK